MYVGNKHNLVDTYTNPYYRKPPNNFKISQLEK